MFYCDRCDLVFAPQPGELDGNEKLFGIQLPECPKCRNVCGRYKPGDTTEPELER